MTFSHSLLSFAALMLLSSYSLAGVYKCTDSQGKTAYQSSACSNETTAVKIDIETGVSTNLDDEQKQKQDQATLIEQQKIKEREKQQELKRQIDSAAQSALNQQLLRENPVQYTAFAIPPYLYDKLPGFVKPFAARLPEIEKFRRLAAQKALATGNCNRVESDQLSVHSKKDLLIFSIDCSTAKNFQFTEKELLN